MPMHPYPHKMDKNIPGIQKNTILHIEKLKLLDGKSNTIKHCFACIKATEGLPISLPGSSGSDILSLVLDASRRSIHPWRKKEFAKPCLTQH
jgi:hypothetical protein